MPEDRFEVETLAGTVRELAEGTPVALAGRVMLWRKMGGLVFGQLQDRSGRVQVALQRDRLGEDEFAAWAADVSLGDFIGVTGERWTTRKGEPSVAVDQLTVLSRSHRSLPDKWAGLTDPEARLRKRYLDLLVNEESRRRILLRSLAVRSLRRQLDEAGFLEVETPILLPAASGASARPFVTRHNALDQDLYLRIAPETYLKRAVAGSLERVYEIAKCFRNEGMDPSHLQEFTMLEFYVAYWNYRDNMRFVRDLIIGVLRDTIGSTEVVRDGQTIDFGAPWPEVDYVAAVREATGVDVLATHGDVAALGAEMDRRGIAGSGEARSYAGLVDLLYKRTVRPNLVQPVFLVHHPAALVPLARTSDANPQLLDMFQVVAGGWELVKAYSELIDPVEQRARLVEQAGGSATGDEESMMMEEDYIEAMEYGMPPMSGVGLGVDRLVAFMTEAPSLREVVLFPTLATVTDAPSKPEPEPPGEPG